MTTCNAKHPYQPDWQIPLGVWAKGIYQHDILRQLTYHGSPVITDVVKNNLPYFLLAPACTICIV